MCPLIEQVYLELLLTLLPLSCSPQQTTINNQPSTPATSLSVHLHHLKTQELPSPPPTNIKAKHASQVERRDGEEAANGLGPPLRKDLQGVVPQVGGRRRLDGIGFLSRRYQVR